MAVRRAVNWRCIGSPVAGFPAVSEHRDKTASAMRSPTGVKPIPLHIVTGFLGSGKTTLLRRLLAVDGWQQSAILINEFGENTCDSQSIAVKGSIPTVIDRGCVCCAMIEPLRLAIYDLFAEEKRGSREPFDRILLETSGLSDPAPILSTLMTDRVLREYVLPGHVIATVDSVNAPGQMIRSPEFQKQVAVANVVVLTKQDMAPRQVLSDLRREIASLNPAARTIDAGEPFTLPIVLQSSPVSDFVAEAPCRPEAGPAFHGDACSFTLAYDRPIDWSVFVVWLTMLLNRHGESVLRVKGVLMGDESSPPLMIQGVQHVMHPPQHLHDWRGGDGRSKLVFIVRGIEPAAIKDSLERFLAWADQRDAQARPIELRAPWPQRELQAP
jgi:G3E family GTPase